MQRLRFTNSCGQEVLFDNTDPYVFWTISGVEQPQTHVINTQATGQHGYTLVDVLLEPRTVTITGHVHGAQGMTNAEQIRLMYELRQRLNAICSPVLGVGTLTYENAHGRWQCAAFSRSKAYARKIRNVQTLSISLECPSPFWLDPEPTPVLLAFVGGGLEFPLVTPTEFGFLGYRAIADNTGDSPVPIEMYISGGAVNPRVTNKTTGEFIHVQRPMETHEELFINTDPEHMEVTLLSVDPVSGAATRGNAYGYLSQDSTIMMMLVPGMNELTFSSDDENRTIRIRIFYRRRFTGV